MPSEEKEATLLEIKSHIYEAINQNQSLTYILDQLGSPKKLAKSYLIESQLVNKTAKFSTILSSLGFGITGIVGTLLIPILLVVSALFMGWVYGLLVLPSQMQLA